MKSSRKKVFFVNSLPQFWPKNNTIFLFCQNHQKLLKLYFGCEICVLKISQKKSLLKPLKTVVFCPINHLLAV